MSTIDRPKTVNELLLDRTIRHAHALERFKTHQVREVIGIMNRGFEGVNEHLAGRLATIRARGNDVDTRATPALRKLSEEVGEKLTSTMNDVRRRHESDLIELAQVETQWQLNAIQSTVPKILDLKLKGPPSDFYAKLVKERPFEGSTMGEWFEGLGKSTKRGIENAINQGLAESETLDQMIARVRGTRENRFEDGVLQVSRRNAESIVRTSTAHVTQAAREETYAANPDVMDEVYMAAVLDNRTTPYCMKIDGKVFKVNEGRRPPFHWSCRTQCLPRIKSLSEMGFKGLTDLPAGTRASMDGQVPAKTTYPEWLKGQSAKRQDEALGPERAELFRSGKVSIEQFTDDNGRTLSLAELRERADED